MPSLFQQVGLLQTTVFESEWQGGFNPYKTTGEACAVGATRTYNYTVFIFEETVSRTNHTVYTDDSAHTASKRSKADLLMALSFSVSHKLPVSHHLEKQETKIQT